MQIKRIVGFTLASLLVAPSYAETQSQSAEKLVASMRKADMTYKELMAIMGATISTMQKGVLTQNREMVEQAGQFIFNHPAPNHAPRDIMPDADQAGGQIRFRGSIRKHSVSDADLLSCKLT